MHKDVEKTAGRAVALLFTFHCPESSSALPVFTPSSRDTSDALMCGRANSIRPEEKGEEKQREKEEEVSIN
jgi:hypothetical protein